MSSKTANPADLEWQNGLPVVIPDWPAPESVRACTTTRQGGVSRGAWESLNLGAGVEDDPEAVAHNRHRLMAAQDLPAEPCWLEQVHGDRVIHLPEHGRRPVQADGAWTDRPGHVCAVLTADCLPVLLCTREGNRVAAVHAGWRGLAAGVIETAVTALGGSRADLLAWLGPAISQEAFEVGPEVRRAFVTDDPGAAPCFRAGTGDRWHADLYALARRRLARVDVHEVWGGHWCTAGQSQWFYSHRRDGVSGRMASLIRIVGEED